MFIFIKGGKIVWNDLCFFFLLFIIIDCSFFFFLVDVFFLMVVVEYICFFFYGFDVFWKYRIVYCWFWLEFVVVFLVLVVDRD